MTGFYLGVLRFRWPILLAVTAVTVWLGAALWPPEELAVDFSFEGLLVADEAERAELDAMRADFGEDVDKVVVLVVVPGAGGADADGLGVLAPDVVRAMDGLADALRARPELDPESVLAPDGLACLRRGEIHARCLADALARLDAAPAGAAADARRAYASDARAVAGSALYRGVVLGSDGRTALVAADFAPSASTADAREPLVAALPALTDALRARLPPGSEVHVTGIPVVEATYSAMALGDLARFVPITAALVALLLLLAFRHPRALWVPLPGVGAATLASLGLMQRLGEPLNLVNNVTGVIVLVIGVADGVHILARWQETRVPADPAGRRRAIAEVMARMTPACFVTSLTTAVGFGSLVTAAIPTVRSFGLFAAAAVMLAFVAQMLLVPIMLSVGAPPALPADGGRPRGLERRLAWVAAAIERRRRAVLLAFAATTALAAVGLAQVRADARALGELPADHPLALATAAVEEHLSGVLSHAIVFTAREDVGRRCASDAGCAPHQRCVLESAPAPADDGGGVGSSSRTRPPRTTTAASSSRRPRRARGRPRPRAPGTARRAWPTRRSSGRSPGSARGSRGRRRTRPS
ncbi:MAG: MMPL family transporter [Myxococcales bacterium]|nr:MMPL family transporter [Myxococcales bacterium]